MRDNRGMTILEVAVSGAILAVILLGIANFSTFTAKMNQSNNQSDSFAGIMSTIDNIIKTQACDTFLGGITVPTTVGSSLAFSGFQPAAGFVLMSPSPAPSGFAFGTGSDPTSFQLTYIAQVDSATVGTATWYLDTFDLRIALKKVDSSGHPMAGTPMQMKDYTVNLWVSGGQTVSPVNPGTPSEYGTCTYKKATIFSGPQVEPSCVTVGGSFLVSWTMPAADQATLSFSPDWAVSPTTLPSGQMTYSVTAPNGNYNDLTVGLTVTDPGNNVSPSSISSPAVSAYQSPTVSASFTPVATFSTLPMSTLAMSVTTNWSNAMGGSLSVTNPITYSLVPNANPSVPVNIMSAVNPQTFPFTVVASNGCGTTAQTIASAVYSTSCIPNCTTSVPVPCPSGQTYPNGCGGSCSCPTGACTGCLATSTYCASTVMMDSCGNSCGTGTEAAGTGCLPPTAVCAGSPMGNDACGNPCPGPAVEACASPSPTPSPSASGMLDPCLPSGVLQIAVPSVSCPAPYACKIACSPQLPAPVGDVMSQCCNNPDPCGCAVCSAIPLTGTCPAPAPSPSASPAPSPSASPCAPDGTIFRETVVVPACGAPATYPQCLCAPVNYTNSILCCNSPTTNFDYTLSNGCVASLYSVCGP